MTRRLVHTEKKDCFGCFRSRWTLFVILVFLGLLWRQFTLIENFPPILGLRAIPRVRAIYTFRVFSYVFFLLFFAHLFANRDQLDNQDGLPLTPENVARELGFSEGAEPCDMNRETQRSETDESSRQECGYAMLTPRTTMVISIKVLMQSIDVDLKGKNLVVDVTTVAVLVLDFSVFQFQL